MNISDLRKESFDNLKKHLFSLYRERFKLSLEKTSGAEFTKTHLLRQCKKNIARVLTLMTEIKRKKT